MPNAATNAAISSADNVLFGSDKSTPEDASASSGFSSATGSVTGSSAGVSAAANNAAYQEATRAEAAYCLGCLYVAKKDYAKAKEAFKRAIVSNPTGQVTPYWSERAKRSLDRLPAGK